MFILKSTLREIRGGLCLTNPPWWWLQVWHLQCKLVAGPPDVTELNPFRTSRWTPMSTWSHEAVVSVDKSLPPKGMSPRLTTWQSYLWTFIRRERCSSRNISQDKEVTCGQTGVWGCHCSSFSVYLNKQLIVQARGCLYFCHIPSGFEGRSLSTSVL